MEVFHFAPTGQRYSALKEVEKVMEVGAFNAVSVLVELRSTCYRFREQEYQNVTFQICQSDRHASRCGIVKGFHFAPSEVKTVVDRICDKLEDLQREMFGMKIPQDMVQTLDNLIDDISCSTPGYSFLTEKRNDVNLKHCRVWAVKQVGLEIIMDTADKRAGFLRHAFRYLQNVLVLLYLCGGAPPRTTELESALITNTKESRREIFANGRSVVMAPLYAKQRSLGRGLFKPVIRYLDFKSSRFFKTYTVFVRPLELLLDSKKKETLWRGDGPLLSFLNKVMRANCVPFTVSGYRQWHTGYARRRNRDMNLVADCINSGNADKIASSVATEDPVVRASLLQGAHSVPTALNVYGQADGFGIGYDHGGPLSDLFMRASFVFHQDCGLESTQTLP